MAVSKVVKLEDILHLEGDKPNARAILAGESLSDVQPGENASELESLEHELDATEADEARDKVYQLPENWPNIPQLSKRRSCELTRSTEPCVQKAISHLELIQNIIEEWFRTRDQADQSGPSSGMMYSQAATPIPRKHLRFEPLSRTGTTSTRRVTTAELMSEVSSEHSSELSVEGEALAIPEEKEGTGSGESIGMAMPYLGAEDVVDEVITLLARLEQDKMMTEERLRNERDRVSQLNKRMDELCRKRLRDLPALVQREHEACLVDLNELQWHISYETRTLAKIKEKTAVDEVVNKRLKEDLDFVRKHIPLLQEKLQLEVEAMEKIKKAQAETNTELQATQQRQAKTEQKSSEALNKAETERGHIKRELDTVRGNLNQISEELSEAKMTYNSYVHQMSDISQQLKDNAQEFKVLKVKSENARVAEEMQNTKVRDLQNRITDAEFEQRRLDNENFQLQQELKTMRATHEHELQTLEAACRQLESKLRAVLLRNQEMSMEIQDLEEKIAQCERERTANEKNINRIYRDIDRTEILLKATLDEHQKVSAINQHVKEQLLMEQDKTFKAEESLKSSVETLRRQVKEEVHARTVLQARINSDSSEIDKSRIESGKKRNKAERVVQEVDNAVAQVQDKVDRLRQVKEQKEQMRQDLVKKIEETKRQHVESEQRMKDRINEIEPQHKKLQEDLLVEQKKLDEITLQANLMRKKMEDMKASESMMNKVMESTLKAIDSLQEEHDELQIQVEDARKLEAQLRANYNDVLERLRTNTAKHTQFMSEREAAYHKHEEEKQRHFQLNKELASKYRQLQNEYVILKEAVLRSYEDRVKLESSINDVRQLQALQKKMHSAMVEYFKLSGMYNEAELEKLSSESASNGLRVNSLQNEMDQALKNITEFLKQQMDISVNRVKATDALPPKPVASSKSMVAAK